jgi:carbohydrate diacid regulator
MENIFEFLQRIIAYYASRMGISIDIAGETGEIIASTREKTIGTVSPSALYVLQCREAVFIKPDHSSLAEKPSIYAIPIFMKDLEGIVVVVHGPSEIIESGAESLSAVLEAFLETFDNRKMLMPKEKRDTLLVQQLLSKEMRENVVLSILKAMEHDPSLVHGVILIKAIPTENTYFNMHLNLGYNESYEKIRGEIINTLKDNEHLNSQDIVAFYDDYHVVIIKSFLGSFGKELIGSAMEVISNSIQEDIAPFKLFDFHIAWGESCEKIFEVRKPFVEAWTMLEIGLKTAPKIRVYRMEDFLLETVEEAIRDTRIARLIDSFLEKINDSDKTESSGESGLLQVAEAYVDSCMSFAETAKRLNIHRNTVTTKLDKLRELSGLDPAVSMPDAFIIKMAAVKLRLSSCIVFPESEFLPEESFSRRHTLGRHPQ